jgi:hypothetical protein
MQGTTEHVSEGFSQGSHDVRHFGDRRHTGAGEAALEAFKDYARERPEVVTMWAFGIGFVLGWKLRIW